MHIRGNAQAARHIAAIKLRREKRWPDSFPPRCHGRHVATDAASPFPPRSSRRIARARGDAGASSSSGGDQGSAPPQNGASSSSGHVGSQRTVREAIQRNHEKQKQLAASARVIECVIATMWAHLDGAGVQQNGCCALANLAADGATDNRTVIGAAGGVQSTFLVMGP